MSQISKYPIRKDVYNEIFNTFLETVAGLTTKNQVLEFFEEFLTPTERVVFSKRLAVGLFIAKGYDYIEIKRILCVSSATVARCSISYKYGSGYKKVIDSVLKNKRIEKFLLNLAEIMSSVGAMGGTKSSVYVYLKKNLRDKISKKIF